MWALTWFKGFRIGAYLYTRNNLCLESCTRDETPCICEIHLVPLPSIRGNGFEKPAQYVRVLTLSRPYEI